MLGYRVWTVAANADGSGPYLLRSPWQGTIWRESTLRAPVAPDAGNRVGVYSRSRYAEPPPPVGLARGTVRLSGRVVEHEDGTLRAQEAQVERLMLVALSGLLVAQSQAPLPYSLLRAEPAIGVLLTIEPRELLRQLLVAYGAEPLYDWPWESAA